MKTIIRLTALAAALALVPTVAEANGKTSKKKIISEREIVRVYEPRAVPPEPLLAISLLGHGLIITDNLDVDLFDIEERRRQHRIREIERRRIVRGRR